MRAVMVMYDSLRLDILPCYGGREIELPNFERLAEKTVTFDNSYVCSLPCMPARRELHTGRANFLHRGWSPLEPFDDSMPEILKMNGVYTRMVTDHNHYVEDGGATYHGRYSSWECNRGQEGDPWKGSAAKPERQASHRLPVQLEGIPAEMLHFIHNWENQDRLNRKAWIREGYPQERTISQGIEFLQNNAQEDNWFLQIETFDPHEPFDVPDRYLRLILDPDTASQLDWPPYAPVTERPEVVDEIRKKYLALVSFCDDSLGKVLDEFDKHNYWKDTMLIVNTDHGFLLGEHGWWAKSVMPDYNEIAHTPLFIWDPRSGVAGKRRSSLVQPIDLAPTLLDFFGVEIPKDMLGKPLGTLIADDTPVREYGIFGYHGSVLNITDGRYVMMLAPKQDATVAYEYTLSPMRMRSRMHVEDLQKAEWVPPFSFTKGCSVMKIPAVSDQQSHKMEQGSVLLYDVQKDSRQNTPLTDASVIARMKAALAELLKKNDAPIEIYSRYEL